MAASQPGVDPVGSCVGMRGARIQYIVDDLNGEKIDVIEWNARSATSSATRSARPGRATRCDRGRRCATAIVVVPDRQLSLAIGKEGQNARLAAKLTGWRIDIKSETEAATEGLSEIKRQQLHRSAPLTGGQGRGAAAEDDLLSRAEWLLRQKDKPAVTLEQAAKMLAEAEAKTTVQAEMLEVIPEVPVPEAAAPQTEAAAA